MTPTAVSGPLYLAALRRRVIPAAIAVVVLGLWLLAAMAIYRDIDLGLYTDLPEGIRGLMGIPAEADTATLAYNVLFSFTGSLTIAGLAVSWGAAAIAGEERDGTVGILLANPISRHTVLLSRLAAGATVTIATSALAWATARLVPVLLGVEIGATRVDAMMIHLCANALFWGALAAAVGAGTGRARTTGAAGAAGMALSYVVAGLFPLVPGLAGLAKISPWYYFDGSEPLTNGVRGSHIVVLLGAAAVFTAVGVMLLRRRDLRSRDSGARLLDILRNHPVTDRVGDALAGRARVSHVWVRVTSEHQGLLVVTAVVMFVVMGVAMGPMYAAVDDPLATFAADVPEQVMALAGGGDLSSPEGWFQAETFSLMAPAALITIAIVLGARALAREEATGSLGVLLANPISRRRVMTHYATAMVAHALVVVAATGFGVAAGSAIAGLGLSQARIAWTCLLALLLGLVFGAIALAIVGATGSSRVASWVTVGLALTSHLLNAFLPLSDRWAPLAEWTPHHYYLGGEPLTSGADVGHLGVLAALVAVAFWVALAAFERRDLS